MGQAGHDSRINYIEMNVKNIAKTKAFYAAAFGWSFTDYGDDYCEFNDGAMKGGFTTLDKPKPGGPLVILYADQLESMEARVKKAGGKIAKPIFAFPGGRRFHFIDPNGYELAVWSEQ